MDESPARVSRHAPQRWCARSHGAGSSLADFAPALESVPSLALSMYRASDRQYFPAPVDPGTRAVVAQRRVATPGDVPLLPIWVRLHLALPAMPVLRARPSRQ